MTFTKRSCGKEALQCRSHAGDSRPLSLSPSVSRKYEASDFGNIGKLKDRYSYLLAIDSYIVYTIRIEPSVAQNTIYHINTTIC